MTENHPHSPPKRSFFRAEISLGQLLIVAPLLGAIWTAASSWNHLTEALQHETDARIAAITEEAHERAHADELAASRVSGELALAQANNLASVRAITDRLDAINVTLLAVSQKAKNDPH
jgi:hypothetical protein